MAVVNNAVVSGNLSNQAYYAETYVHDFLFAYGAQFSLDGTTTFTLDVPLSRNSIVKKLDFKIKAQRAEATIVQNVAQVRANSATSTSIAGHGLAIVIDFGTPRTVSAVQVPDGLEIATVTPWIGMGFAPSPVYNSVPFGPHQGAPNLAPPAPSNQTTAILPSEVRTERLLVEVLGDAAIDAISTGMSVVLPESPSDIELRIDGGGPVFTSPGPVSYTPDATLSDAFWNSGGERLVHLAAAFAALTGDPISQETVAFKLTLTSRVPGVLAIEALGGTEVSRIRRMHFGTETEKDLQLTEEGLYEIPLSDVPAAASIEEVRAICVATPPPERTLPPIGPDDANLAELLIDSTRAVCVRLHSGTGLEELTALRFPLRWEPGGAEARIVLWSNKEPGTEEPAEAIADATSASVSFADPAPSADVWTTFTFSEPFPLEESNLPWAALLVSRGTLLWNLGAAGDAEEPPSGNVIRRGPPEGPWKMLPTPFRTGTTGLGLARGRVRMTGHAPDDAPIAPLTLSLQAGGAEFEVIPVPKGASISLPFSPSVALSVPALRVLSRTAGKFTFRDVDVISTT